MKGRAWGGPRASCGSPVYWASGLCWSTGAWKVGLSHSTEVFRGCWAGLVGDREPERLRTTDLERGVRMGAFPRDTLRSPIPSSSDTVEAPLPRRARGLRRSWSTSNRLLDLRRPGDMGERGAHLRAVTRARRAFHLSKSDRCPPPPPSSESSLNSVSLSPSPTRLAPGHRSRRRRLSLTLIMTQRRGVTANWAAKVATGRRTTKTMRMSTANSCMVLCA